MTELNRRGFLGLVGKGALLGLIAELLPEGGPLSVAWADERGSAQVAVAALPRSPFYGDEADQQVVDAQVEKALAATFDLGRIQPGHVVLIKVAANSPYKYPMVAHPMVLRSVIRLAKARGASVRIVDQPGFEHVLQIGDDEMGRRLREKFKTHLSGYSAGMEVHRSNGLLQVAEDEGVPFEAGDLETDYEQATGSFQHWPARKFGRRQQLAGFRVHKRAMEAVRNPTTHHVISIVRPAAHVQAGHTGPTKTWYGWIYTADRLWSHLDLRRIRDGDPFDGHDHQKVWNPLTWFGRTEVARLHECIAEAAAWFERNLPIRAHVVGAIDSYCDVGPDWAKVAMKRPNVVAASATALPLDAFHAALLAEEKSLTPRDERRRQAIDNMPAVAGHASTPAWRRTLETPLFYGIENQFHDWHGTHYWDDIVRSLERGETARTQGALWSLRQLGEGARLAGSSATAPPAITVNVVDGGAELVSPTIGHLMGAPTTETPGIIRRLQGGAR